jgi:hypothetical protein
MPVLLRFPDGTALAMSVKPRPSNRSRQRIKEKTGMKRTLTILSAALLAGTMVIPVVQAQEPAAGGAPAASSSMAAPAAEATPGMMKKKHHIRHHRMRHKKSSMKGGTKGESGAAPSTGAGQ